MSESKFFDYAMPRMALYGATAVVALGAHTEAAQASYAPNPDQQALIDQSMSIVTPEWESSRPDLTANNPCKNILRITMGTDAELFNPQEGTDNQAQATGFPRCEIQLSEGLFQTPPNTIFRPAKACEIIKHEVGHIIGLDHVNNPADPMNVRGPDAQFYRIASPGCADLNRPVFLSDRGVINATAALLRMKVSVCRTDLLRKNSYKTYLCAERDLDNPAEKTYDRYPIKSNQPYGDDGRLENISVSSSTVTKKMWDKNIKKGAKILKQR